MVWDSSLGTADTVLGTILEAGLAGLDQKVRDRVWDGVGDNVRPRVRQRVMGQGLVWCLGPAWDSFAMGSRIGRGMGLGTGTRPRFATNVWALDKDVGDTLCGGCNRSLVVSKSMPL